MSTEANLESRGETTAEAWGGSGSPVHSAARIEGAGPPGGRNHLLSGLNTPIFAKAIETAQGYFR